MQEFKQVNNIAMKGLLSGLCSSTSKLKNSMQVLSLYLMCLYDCWCQADEPDDFKLLATLTNYLRMDLTSKPIYTFDCSRPRSNSLQSGNTFCP